jgi:hypothetical protein
MKNVNVNKIIEAMKVEIEYVWKDYYTTCIKVENLDIECEIEEWKKVLERKENIAKITGRQYFYLLEELEFDIDLKIREIKEKVKNEVEEKVYVY